MKRLLIPSYRLRHIPHLRSFLPESENIVAFGLCDAVAGWGRKPTSLKARKIAADRNVPYLSLEDGFLRSFGSGIAGAPPLSLVLDRSGIYYDSTVPSDLENLLNQPHLSEDLITRARTAMEWLRKEKLSKYNKGLAAYTGGPIRRLIVDQATGDASVAFSGAEAGVFEKMIDDALQVFDAESIAVKLHPDTLGGERGSYLRDLALRKGLRLIDTPVNPWEILAAVDEVATISSQFGFEALMAGKKVHCYGLPFYAGWGLTEDKIQCPRRQRKRSTAEIFAAAYISYARYVDPFSGAPATLENTIGLLSDMVRHEKKTTGGFSGTGFSPWKRWFMPKFIGRNRKDGAQLLWASRADNTPGVARIEDGFVRSRGLGALLARPWSLVLDKKGIYYDPRSASDLEDILQNTEMSAGLLQRAREIRRMLIEKSVSKYNIGNTREPVFNSNGRKVILVPGQVEDDASILTGGGKIRTNIDLLKTVRADAPEAFIIYKPHPDVEARRRKGKIDDKDALQYCDSIVRGISMGALWPVVDAVHTMTSLAGFEALLRMKEVKAYGKPFYAGWGLTQDYEAIARRTKKLSTEELIAGALILYPFYYDWKTSSICNIETVIHRLSRKAS